MLLISKSLVDIAYYNYRPIQAFSSFIQKLIYKAFVLIWILCFSFSYCEFFFSETGGSFPIRKGSVGSYFYYPWCRHFRGKAKTYFLDLSYYSPNLGHTL